MRKLLYLALLMGLPLGAQTNQPTFQYVNVIPTGTCVGTPPIQILYLTGQAYSCNNGTWGQFAGGGGGGGTPTGPAGGALGGFYPNPSLAASGALPNGWTATTQSPGDTSALVANDAFVAAAVAAAAGTPGGADTDVQVNHLGTFLGYPGFTYDNSTQTMTVGPLGTATSSTNFDSGVFSICGSYWTGTAPANGCATIQSTMGPTGNPYLQTNFIFTNPGGGQFNFPYSVFLNGFSINATNSSGVFTINEQGNMPSGSYGITPPTTPPTVTSAWTCDPSSSPLTIPSICHWAAGGSGGGGAVTPAQFGGFGDALGPQDGMGTTASSNVVTCPDGCFVSSDVGKQVWVKGAGPSGAAFNATITAYTDSTHVTVSATATATVTNTPQNGVYGHDDAAAVQACWNYSAKNGVPCAMTPTPIPTGGAFSGFFGGFLIGSAGLQISSGPTSSGPNVTGGAMSNNVNLFCEFNGDCVSLAAGPIQGAYLANFTLQGDQTQPNGRGWHFNAAAGVFGIGGLWFSTFTNVLAQNFNQECLLSEGGNYFSGGLLPNQVDTFINFNCNAPLNQMHTANLIKMTGQHAQIVFINGQTNGPAVASNQPNAMILITEQNATHGDSATDVKFYGYTYEVGLIGLQLGNGAYNIHYDNSYVENVASPLIAGGDPGAGGVFGMTYNGNHLANSGNVGGGIAQFTGGVTGSMRDNLEYGGAITVSGLAVCTGTSSGGVPTNQIDFVGNTVLNGPGTTTGCVTTLASPPSNTLTVTGGTSVSVAADSSPIVNLNASLSSPGKTMTLYASGTFSLATSGNINLGGNASPLVVPAGSSVTLTLLDQTVGWLVTSVSAPFIAPGTAPTITGCGTISAQHGNATAGDFTTSTTGTCTAVIPLPAATNGWHCDMTDITQHAVANIMLQNATSTTSCTVTGTTAASDVLSFKAVPY